MRRAVKTTLCVFLLFGYSCTGLLDSEAAGAPSPEETNSNISGGFISEKEVQGAAGSASEKKAEAKAVPSFPRGAFEKAFQQLAEEMLLPDDKQLNQFKAALKTLFTTTPEAFEKGESRHTSHGLLKKMLAAKMDRGSGEGSFNPEFFAREFAKALNILKDFIPDEKASPAQVLEGLARSTQTQLTAENAGIMQGHLTHTAQLLREVLPVLTASTDEEL